MQAIATEQSEIEADETQMIYRVPPVALVETRNCIITSEGKVIERLIEGFDREHEASLTERRGNGARLMLFIILAIPAAILTGAFILWMLSNWTSAELFTSGGATLYLILAAYVKAWKWVVGK